MAVNLSPVGGVAGQFFDNNGNPLSGGKIFTYAAGTTTNQVTYTSATGLTAHSNPIILDSGGRVPSGEIWLTDGLQYKFVIQSSTNQLIGTFDNISGINSNFVNYTIQEEIQTATAGQTVFTLTTMSYSPATNSLSVFVDGVNQYEGGAYSYIETSSTTVTFTAGLHVGAEVKFTTAVFTAGSVGNAANVTYDPAGVGAVPMSVEDKLRESVSVKDFGAVGDGVADDSAAINSAITYANSIGGGTVYLPSGVYLVSNTSFFTAVEMLSNVHLMGSGQNATILKLANGGEAHVIVASDKSNISVSNLTVDGNRANQTANVHGVRLQGVNGCTIENVEIKETAFYGIGLQDGTFKRIKIDKVYIHDTGADGIDVKNKNQNNEEIQISNITIRQWGLNVASTIQAGIDARGVVELVNIDCRDPGGNDRYGIRFRQGELVDTNGFGGHKSSLTNFFIDMGTSTNSYGLGVIARDVTISNGYIQGGFRGILMQDSGTRLSQVTVANISDRGYLLDDLGGGLDADECVLTSCHAHDCGNRGFVVDTKNCQLIGCYSYNNLVGIDVRATAVNTKIIGGFVGNNSTANVQNGGTNTTFTQVSGLLTESFLESASLAVDITGSRVAVLPHGLAGTPDLKKCTVNVIAETSVTDYVLGFVRIEGVSSTNIQVRAFVTSASATAGATMKLGVTART